MFTILIHGQTSQSTVLGKWYAKFRTGKFRSGVAFTICTNQFHLSRPETGIKDGFQEMEHKLLLGIFCPEKTGPPFQIFRCSRKFSAGTTQKGVSHLLSNWIFWKLFVNGEQPLLYMPIFNSILKLPNL